MNTNFKSIKIDQSCWYRSLNLINDWVYRFFENWNRVPHHKKRCKTLRSRVNYGWTTQTRLSLLFILADLFGMLEVFPEFICWWPWFYVFAETYRLNIVVWRLRSCGKCQQIHRKHPSFHQCAAKSKWTFHKRTVSLMVSFTKILIRSLTNFCNRVELFRRWKFFAIGHCTMAAAIYSSAACIFLIWYG